MEPNNNRPAGTQSATGVAHPTEAVICEPHLTASNRLRGEERSAKRQKASSGAALDSQNRPSAVSGLARNLKCQRHFNLEAANPGSPLGEPTCTLPMLEGGAKRRLAACALAAPPRSCDGL